MSLQITGVATGLYDSTGTPITAAYWKIVSVQANVINSTFSCVVNGYADSTSFNANIAQTPLLQQQINYPDPSVTTAWPFAPATLQANYPNNSAAFLLAAQAYCMLFPFFSGATQVA